MCVCVDGHYSALLAELEADAQDLEGESWSVSVDQQYIKRLHKDAIKRQDVIYGKTIAGVADLIIKELIWVMMITIATIMLMTL